MIPGDEPVPPPLPPARLSYAGDDLRPRPPLVGVIGFLGIVAAGFSLLFSICSGPLLIMRWNANGAPPVSVTQPLQPLAVATPGMDAAQSAIALDILHRAQPLTPAQRSQLDALLRVHGQAIFSPNSAPPTPQDIRAAIRGANVDDPSPVRRIDLISSAVICFDDNHAVFHAYSWSGPSVCIDRGRVVRNFGPVPPPRRDEIIARLDALTGNGMTPAQRQTLRTQFSMPTQSFIPSGDFPLDMLIFSNFVASPADPNFPNGAQFDFADGGISMTADGNMVAHWSSAGVTTLNSKPRIAGPILLFALVVAAIGAILSILWMVAGGLVLQQRPNSFPIFRRVLWFKFVQCLLSVVASASIVLGTAAAMPGSWDWGILLMTAMTCLVYPPDLVGLLFAPLLLRLLKLPAARP